MMQPTHEMLDALLAQLDELEAIDATVADTEPGPAHLAGLWGGELDRDLSEPVIRQIRFDQFVRAIVSMGADIAVRMGSAAIEYSVGRDDAILPDDDAGDDAEE